MSVRLLCIGAAALGMIIATAGAEPYWIAYEGNDFPENEGWERGYSGGGAERSIEDGVLVLDGLADLGVNDYYGYDQYPIDPGPGELFVAEFRFAIDEIISGPDPEVVVFSDDSWAVGFAFSDDHIRTAYDHEIVSFDFVGFHAFRFTSSDMRHYQLEVDGELLYEGAFTHVFSSSQLVWGDGIQGGASLTRWDFMRFGVVPEPSTLIIAVFATLTLSTNLRR